MILPNVYAWPLQAVFIAMVGTSIAWAIIDLYVQRHRNAYPLWRILNSVLACLALAGILHFTIVDRTGSGTYTLPFIRTIEHIRAQPELIREMLMNAFLFFPFGLTLPYALGSLPDRNGEKRRGSAFMTMAAAFLLTCGIELTQYLCSFGNCELSDIIMNILGAAIGTVPFTVSSRQTK